MTRQADTAIAAATMVKFAPGDDQGKCQLVTIEHDDGDGMDPRFKCEALWESVKDDWPGWEVAYCTNEAADKLAEHRRLWQVGIPPEGGENLMTGRIEKYNAEVEARRQEAVNA